MAKKSEPIDPALKLALRFHPKTPDAQIYAWWRRATTRYCKPCWELRYCPYGPLVEESPLIGGTREEMIEHNNYLKQRLKTRQSADGEPLKAEQLREIRRMVKSFRPEHWPVSIPDTFMEMNCNVFGHICPVVWAAEEFTETAEDRRTGRYIPFKMKIRVVRRDNYTCQHCGAHLRDFEVEFDHIIPVAKGGSSEEHNIRLTCHPCNADKSDRYEV